LPKEGVGRWRISGEFEELYIATKKNTYRVRMWALRINKEKSDTVLSREVERERAAK
jgi:hypothetical protein